MFETRPPPSDALDSDAGLALRTARSLGFAWRQLIGKLSVRHSTNLRLFCPGVDLKSRRNEFLAVDRFQRDDPNIGNQFRAAARLVRSMPLLISSIQAATAFSRVRKCGGPWTVRPFRVNVPAPKPRLHLLHVVIDGSVLHQSERRPGGLGSSANLKP